MEAAERHRGRSGRAVIRPRRAAAVLRGDRGGIRRNSVVRLHGKDSMGLGSRGRSHPVHLRHPAVVRERARARGKAESEEEHQANGPEDEIHG